MEGLDRLKEEIVGIIRGIPDEGRERAIASLRDILDRELFDCCRDPIRCECPRCKCERYVRNGHTAAGTQRYRCCSCGKTFCLRDNGLVLALTKLPRETWMRYAEYFVLGLTSPKVAKLLEVTQKTAWFMRIRTLEALYKNLPSFEVKAGCGCELDDMYFAESFKGVSLKAYGGEMPRPARHLGSKTPQGISDEQICVMTGINDNGDMFFEVACRGALTHDVASSVLEERIHSGAIVNTDRHRSYKRVLAEIGVASHVAHDAKLHEGLERIDDLHSGIRSFLNPFHGVSTKWLHLYLTWYKWIRSFAWRDNDERRVAIRQIDSGDYEHVWRSINEMPLPFRDSNLNPMKT